MSMTYGLEEHMEYLGNRNSEAKVLAGLWTVHKAQLGRKVVPNPDLFGTYSDHGPSHSAAIVNAINRLLGSDRIRLLEETDTWLLLECAYRHDIGMHVSAREITEFIKTHEYKDLLKNTCGSDDKQLREAAMSLLVRVEFDKECQNMTAAEKAQLIVEYKRYLNMVLSGYYRGKHAERSAVVLNDEVCKYDDNDIPDRIWRILSQICLGHTMNRQAAYDSLNYDEQGICNDTAHPRFVQTLLRLGDLLDLDNNRFNPYNLEQWGDEIPDESAAHLVKHKVVKHFYIGPDRIEVEADIKIEEKRPAIEFGCLRSEKEVFYKKTINDISESWNKNPPDDLTNGNKLSADKVIDKLMGGYTITATADARLSIEKQEEHYAHQAKLQNKACRICANWFMWLEEELQFFAINWIDISPAYISGSVPKLSDKKIFWQGREMDYDTINLKYSISHKRAAGIIQGTGLYGSYLSKKAPGGPSLPNKELVFIRELVQNAMDATKIQTFRYLKEDRFCKSLLDLGNRTSGWNPIKVLDCIGDFIKGLKVEVKISYEIDVLRTESSKKRPRLIIEVKDTGTGINDNSLKCMSMIGSTRNNALQNEIQQMPEWLRPNGSFGIGMQSVFGIVDEFRAISGSRTDHIVRDMFFKSSENNGELFAAERSGNDMYNYGTKIIVEMDEPQLEKIYASITHKNKNFTDNGSPLPSLGFSCDYLFSSLRNQIDRVLGQDVFPIDVIFAVNEIEIKQYNIYRKGLFTELVELYKHVNDLPLKNPPYSMLLLPPNGVGDIKISTQRALLASKAGQNIYARTNDKKVNEKMRSAIPLSDYAYDLLPVSQQGEKIIPLIVEPLKPRGSIRLLHYSEQHQIFLKMELYNFDKNSIIDGRSKQSGGLRRVKFFYRGMNVAGVEREDAIVYPCWDIEAHGFFNEAENIISINRNHILPNAEAEVYKRIAESADEALDLLFSWMSEDENFRIVMNNCSDSEQTHLYDGLYLSLLYRQVTCAHNRNSRHIDYKGLYEKLKGGSHLRMPVLRYNHSGLLDVEKMFLKDVFDGGVYNKWYVNPTDVPYTESRGISMEEGDREIKIYLLAQDIFTEYLLGRKYFPLVRDIHALKESDLCPFAFIHQIAETSVSGYRLSGKLLKLAIEDMEKTYVRERIDSTSCDCIYGPNDFPLLPALDIYPLLSLSNPHMAIPQKLNSIGKYLIVPFTISQLRRIKRDAANISKYLINPDDKRKWLNDFLKADSTDSDVPFQKLNSFVLNEITKTGVVSSLEKVKQCYLEVASVIVDVYVSLLAR